MNFSEQADTLVKNLADAQKQTWDAWYGLASGALGKDAYASMLDPSVWFRPGSDAQSKGGESLGGSTIDRLFAAQSATTGVLDFLTTAWKLVAPNVEAGKPWQPDLQKFVSQWSEQLLGAPERVAGMGSDLQGLFGSLLSVGQSAMAPGLASWKDMGLTGHLGAGGFGGSSALNRLMDMGAEMHPALAGVGDLPRAGLTREKNAKFLRYFDATTDMRNVSIKYRTAMAGALGKAVERTVEKLAKLAEEGEKITSVRELSSLWYRTADATLIDTFNSEEFLEIQNDLSAATMTLKSAQREVLELIFQALEIPTRSEINDAYRIIHDLKKDVRELKKAQAAANTPAPARRPRKRAKDTKTDGS